MVIVNNYEIEILHKGDIAKKLADAIDRQDELIVLKNGEAPYKVVIGIPHQAKSGVRKICSIPKSRASDENAASYPIVAFNSLKEKAVSCKLVIMAHATGKDPNKYDDTPYFQEIFSEKSELLFECHGASKERQNDIELSAGSNKLSNTVEFGEYFVNRLRDKYKIGIQIKTATKEAFIFEKNGTKKKEELERAGNNTKSLIVAEKENGIPALHLEAKPKFRKPVEGKTISDDGSVLGEAIAQSLFEYMLVSKVSILNQVESDEE